MNGLIFICLIFCAVRGFKEVSEASRSASAAIGTVKDVIDIKKEFDVIRDNRKNKPGKKRPKRYSFSRDFESSLGKLSAGAFAYLKTYLYQPIAHGNFLESTIRGYNMLHTDEGKFVFGTLDGELNQSFRSLITGVRTGDIISCRIPTSRMAEHYMMVLNNKIVEVSVVGGKDTHNGVISIDSYKKSSYINSTECLLHKNRLISRAEQIDERNGDDKETDRNYEEIFNRINCTISGRNTGQFDYDVMSCNCQDLVLYWAYGYVESNCFSAFFNGCSRYLTYYLPQISNYVDETGHLAEKAKKYEDALINLGNLVGG